MFRLCREKMAPESNRKRASDRNGYTHLHRSEHHRRHGHTDH